jgi:PQQ-dependent dehydrogenase (methanol/ethanol family)
MIVVNVGRGTGARAFAAALVLSLLAGAAAAAPSPDPTPVVDGRVAYATHCASCHGATLSGGSAPSLNSTSFKSRWLTSADSVAELDRTVRRMPKGAPDSLPDPTYAAIKAYLLSANGYGQGAGPAPAARARTLPALPAPPDSVAAATTAAPTAAELLAPADGDWLMYNRTYEGQRFSPLAHITAKNADQLQVACILQVGESGSFMASPIIYKGVGYITSAHSVVAFDAATCDKKWTYTYVPTDREPLPTNRGAALYDGKIFRGTSDGHLLAIDAATGKLLWDVHVADSTPGNFIGVAPIVYQGKVIVGLAGSDWGIRGHIYAFDADSGRRIWTFNSIPTGNEPGAESWKKGSQFGGGGTWTSFAVDPKDGLVLAPIGNPAPDLMKEARPGDNLYTNSVVALDAATGRLAWHVQQVPADFHDWDTAAPPVAYEQDGRRYMAVGSKDGFIYLYDRDSRALLARTPVTTNKNADAPLVAGQSVFACPGPAGGVEWNGPAYSPDAKATFVGTVDWCSAYKLEPDAQKPGDIFFDGDFTVAPMSDQSGWLKSLDGASGKELWSYHAPAPMVGGVTPTAGGVVLTGCSNGEFLVFDAKTGAILYRFHTGGSVSGGVSTYMVGERQYVAVTSGNRSIAPFGLAGQPTLIVFSLRP